MNYQDYEVEDFLLNQSFRNYCLGNNAEDRAFWEEINHVIMMYGGSLARFLRNLHTRLCNSRALDRSDDAEAGWAAAPSLSLSHSTGPP